MEIFFSLAISFSSLQDTVMSDEEFENVKKFYWANLTKYTIFKTG